MSGTEIRKVDVAKLAGVKPPSIGWACRPGGPLHGALTSSGRLLRDHPAVEAYIRKPPHKAANRIHREEIRAGAPPVPSSRPTKSRVSDPIARAFAVVESSGVRPEPPAAEARAEAPGVLLPRPPIPEAPEPLAMVRSGADPALLRENHVRQYLFDVEQQLAGAFPDDIEDLGAMTLREVTERFGSLQNLKDAVKALANFADMRNKEGLAAKRRGELVARTVVTGTFLPLVDLAFSRLVGEAPMALADQVIARVNSGGEDLRTDVEALIRDENAGILQDCKDKIVSEFRRRE